MKKSELLRRLHDIPGNPHVLIPLHGQRKWFAGVDHVTYQPSKRNPHVNAGVITLERVRPVRVPTGWEMRHLRRKLEMEKQLKRVIAANRFNARDARRLTNEAKDREADRAREEKAKREMMYVTANLEPELNKILNAIQVEATHGHDQYIYYLDHVHAEPLLNELMLKLRELKFTVEEPSESEDHGGWNLYIGW